MFSDSEHSSNLSSSDSENTTEPTIAIFNLFEYISNSPTVIGIKSTDFSERKYKKILWDAYLAHKDKLPNILEVLFSMNSIQRNLVCKTWTSRRDGGGTDLQSVLKDFFADLKNEQLSLKLLLFMLKNLDELDAEWIHDALEEKNQNNKRENDELIIEIICTRTYKQLRELCLSYKKRYKTELLRDIKLKYRKIDLNFIKMCENLLSGQREENVLIKPEISHLTADVKDINNALKLNKIPSNVLIKLGKILTTRSWRHIHDLCPVYAQLIGYNLQTSLEHKLSHNELPSNIAMINIVEISRSIHLYFANRLKQCFNNNSTNSINMLHRIVLSRSEIDLGAIFLLFSSKENLCYNKTIKQWITEKISKKKQPIHQKILLFLCGLPLDDESFDNDIKEDENDEQEEQVYYAVTYDEFVGSVNGVVKFNCELDVQSIMNWIHPIQDGEATKDERKKLKDRMAKLLCNRNSVQRDAMTEMFFKKHKSHIYEYLKIILKKGSSLIICKYLLTTIIGCNCIKLQECIDDKNLNGISDILCTNNENSLKDMVKYYNFKYKSNLISELEETCNRQKKQTLFRIWKTLLTRNNNNNSVNMKQLSKDVKFLRNFKKHKFKNIAEDDKKRIVNMFINNNKIYLRALNIQFQQRSHDHNLITLIDKVLGIKSGSGYAIKIIFYYSINQSEYFAKLIYDLGKKNWNKYEKEISFIFISRSEIDLYSIQLAFHNNLYGNGKILTQWVSEKTNESKTGLFLVLLLQSLAKNKNPEQQTRDTLRAISASNYSNVYTPRHTIRNYDTNIAPQAFFTPTSNAGSSLTLGIGFGELYLTKNAQSALSPKKSITQEFHVMDTYDDGGAVTAVVEKTIIRKKSQSHSKSKSKRKKVVEEKKESSESVSKVSKGLPVKVERTVEKVKSLGTSPGIRTPVGNRPITPGTKMKKLSASARQEMAKKIINTLTKKVKLSEIDIKNKNSKIEPDELFDFLKNKKIMVPRYISNVVFEDIDLDGDGHITMFEYFKWKSKISVVKMFDILPDKVPDIDDDDAYYFEEGIPSEHTEEVVNSEEKTDVEIVEKEENNTTTNDELKILEEKLALYKKLLNLTLRNKNEEPLNRNIFQAYCNKNDFGLNKQQIYRIFDDMDYDKDGKITPIEYFKWRDKISIGYLNDLLSNTNENNNKITPKISPIITPKITPKTKVETIKEEVTETKTNNTPIINKNDLKEITSPYSQSDYLELKTQITILVDENRKKWSLYLLDWNDTFNEKLSFLDFVKQYLDAKIVTQLFKRFGKNNIVSSDGFAELLTFTYTLYRAKLKREFYKGDNTFKKMDKNSVRPKIEHFVIWVVRSFGKELMDKNHTVCIENPTDSKADEIEVGEYNEYEFKLKEASYANDLAIWIKKYIEKHAEHEDIETAWMILMIWLE